MKRPRGTCPECGRDVAIAANGTVCSHTKRDQATMSYTRLISTHCRGSGQLPVVRAPWTDEQVAALNRFQRGPWHPFTCGHKPSSHGYLVATNLGWECRYCDYRQDWAHLFMTQTHWDTDDDRSRNEE